MRFFLRSLAICLVVATTACASAGSRPSSPAAAAASLDAAALGELHDTMRGLVDSGKRAGIAYGVMHKGRVVAIESHGFRDQERRLPMAADSIVRIFSMSRALSSAAILTLVEEGRIGLDDPVAKYLPEFAATRVLSPGAPGGTVAQAPAMTIRHLFTYTSGLGYSPDWPKSYGFELSDVLDPEQSTETGIRKLAALPLLGQPGEKWRYGFSGDVLGRIAEVATGKPLDVFLEERLFGPLGMKDTGFWASARQVDRLAQPYERGADGRLVRTDKWAKEYGTFDRPVRFLSAGGGLVSTLTDYLRFGQMLVNGGELDGKRILGKPMVDMMLSRQTHAAQGFARGSDVAWGLGIGVTVDTRQDPDSRVVRQAGWGGLMNTSFFVDRENEIVAVVMTQYLGPEADLLPQTLREGVYRALRQAEAGH